MRAALTILHRYVGLAIAAFLFVAGTTGAVIAWNRELDAFLNPDLMRTSRTGTPIPSLDLAHALEARDPRLRVTYLPLTVQPGRSLSIFVAPRIDPSTGRPFALGYNQVFVDPTDGRTLGHRAWGQAWPITRATLLPFLYKLHYSLQLPAIRGEPRVGIWLMGSVAAVWFLDCFVGLYLTLPRRIRRARTRASLDVVQRGWWERWAPAWRIKTRGSGFRLVFDIHRASGLWTWALLLIVAFTGFALALNGEILRPALSTVARVTPTPLDGPAPPIAPRTLALGLADIVAHARAEGRERGETRPLGAIASAPALGLYAASFFDGDEGEAKVAPRVLYLDGRDGHVLGEQRPWAGTPADVFLQAQFPLHSGRILGLPGRILISILGVAVAALSASGVIVWWRKRAAGARARVRAEARPARTVAFGRQSTETKLKQSELEI